MTTMRIALARQARPTQRTRRINGMEFVVSTPPSYLPDGLAYEYNEESGMLRIDFKYLGDAEKGERMAVDEKVSFVIGKHTKKLLAVEIHVDRRGEELHAVQMVVTDKVPKALQRVQAGSPVVKDNYGLAGSALREHGEAIASAVCQ
jgi:hypothetical protein